MALDDYVEPEVGLAVAVTAAVTAAVASPRVRKTLRQGAVYGLAGLLMAGDKLGALARSAAQKTGEATTTSDEKATSSKPSRKPVQPAAEAASG